jgi:hypothetical protein
MPLISLHALTHNIQRKLNITENEARRYAETLMELFGYDDCIIDNVLDHAERRLFYRLEAEGLLYTRRDEAVLSDGTNWRIRYWVFQKNVLFEHEPKKIEQKKKVKISHAKTKPAVKPTPAYDSNTVYSDLPDTAWTTRKTHVA